MTKLTFILGGARSGKSAYAQTLAGQRVGDDVLYVATLRETAEVASDIEMQQRIAKHRAARPSTWRTLVVGDDPCAEMNHALQAAPAKLVLLDCLAMLVSGTLFMGDTVPTDAEDCASQLVESLVALQHHSNIDWIVVSNEVGLSVVPDNALARAYRDALGRANQRIAAHADEVYFLVAGLPQRFK
ncbi:MAG: bifunctional adenosylcobinamide kinase/adenosylcobinamide-phosphate guanylyltransferase [Anaerolineae bacterium]|nr:bifunctional adenosylcobinamide kinase/adenosylcobinamide-phosphate guanylyltransferase [Anaerolineae bacterium]